MVHWLEYGGMRISLENEKKQLDNAADETRVEVTEYQTAHNNEADRGHGRFDDVLELER